MESQEITSPFTSLARATANAVFPEAVGPATHMILSMWASTPFEFNIPTAQVTMHFRYGGKGVAVGKYSEEDNLLDIAEDWDVNARGNLTVGGVFSATNVQHLGAIGYYHHRDFDELAYKTGYYMGSSVPAAVSCSHYPVNKTGVLEVISSMTPSESTESGLWGFAYQTYRTTEGKIYTRSYYSNSGWTAWMEVTLKTLT